MSRLLLLKWFLRPYRSFSMFPFPNRTSKNLKAISTLHQSLHKLKCIYCPTPNSCDFLDPLFKDFGSFSSTSGCLRLFSVKDNLSEPKIMLRSKKDNFALKWIWISYFSRLVDSEQHVHRISDQSWGMAFSHHGVAFQKHWLTEKGLAVDPIDEFSGFCAFGQPASHNVEKTIMNGCGMAPPSCRMRWSFGFEFPARSVESAFIFLNIHD